MPPSTTCTGAPAPNEKPPGETTCTFTPGILESGSRSDCAICSALRSRSPQGFSSVKPRAWFMSVWPQPPGMRRFERTMSPSTLAARTAASTSRPSLSMYVSVAPSGPDTTTNSMPRSSGGASSLGSTFSSIAAHADATTVPMMISHGRRIRRRSIDS